MIEKITLCRTLLLGIALAALPAVGSVAAEASKPAAKAAKPAKAARQEAPPVVAMQLEPRAIEILKASSSRLAAARTMSFRAVISYESPSRYGAPLVYTTHSDVVMQRPDKLRVISPGDGPATDFFYDGKKMVAFAPVENLVAIADAPPTIDATLKAAYDSAAIYFPFTDVIVTDPYKDIADGLRLAFYIGQSREVGGVLTDMIAYANDDVFVQAWIGVDDKLPRRLRAVYASDQARLRHQMELSAWQLDIPVTANVFDPVVAISGGQKIPFAHPDQTPKSMPAMKPPARGKSAKAK